MFLLCCTAWMPNKFVPNKHRSKDNKESKNVKSVTGLCKICAV